jgi:hypothetical protein
MARRNSNSTFWYERGNLKFRGQTDLDRNLARNDIRLYWTYRILMALAIVIMAIAQLIKNH